MQRYLIITADDFGQHITVNEAVEQAAQKGVLTAASLMVSGPAAADAIDRARRLHTLRVGLHVVLADGYATLPRKQIPQLVDEGGFLSDEMLTRSMQMAFLPRVRQQIEMEIHAQFVAFARTGLTLDHVNVHKHLHLHPIVLGMLTRVAKEYGAPACRVPDEPLGFAFRQHWLAGICGGLMKPLIVQMRCRLRAAGILHNDHVFGLAASGAMNKECLLGILGALPVGITEIYMHPATVCGPTSRRNSRTYQHAEELSGLLSSEVRQALRALDVRCGGYSDLVGSA